MVHPSTSTTIAVLGAGGLTAIALYALSKKWEGKKEAPTNELLLVLGAYGAIAYLIWNSAGEHKPSTVQLLASGVRGASKGGL